MNKIIFLTFIIMFLFKTGNVFSKSNIFYVDNIIINNKNNQSKEVLLNKAFKEGFEKLVKKILLRKDSELVLKTNLNDIKKMISTYQIKHNEDLKKTDELTVNLSFDTERMNDFFYSKGISYADISKTNLVLLPVLIEDNNFYLFSENYFFINWNDKNKEKNNEFIDYILPVENLEDIQLIKNSEDNLELVEIKEILSGYDIENYIFLVIKPSEKKVNVFLKGLFSENKITKNFEFYIDDQNRKSRFKKTIKKIKQEIDEIWKSQNLIDVRTPSFLNIVLNIKKKNDLLNFQMALKNIEVIENFYVLELNKDYAKIKIKYFGKMDKIKNKFYENKIKLENLDNQWKVNLI